MSDSESADEILHLRRSPSKRRRMVDDDDDDEDEDEVVDAPRARRKRVLGEDDVLMLQEGAAFIEGVNKGRSARRTRNTLLATAAVSSELPQPLLPRQLIKPLRVAREEVTVTPARPIVPSSPLRPFALN